MFGKHFASTYTGSMVGAGPTVFAVWGYVIANAKPPGVVEINPVILAAILGCPTADVLKAVEFLSSPDPKSRSKENDGRRLTQTDEFSYLVNTWQKYRDMATGEDQKAYNREAQRRYREAQKAKLAAQSGVIPSVNDMSTEVKGNKDKTEDRRQKEEERSQKEENTDMPPSASVSGFEDEIRILDRLNELSHRNYRKIPTNLKLIRARLQETEVTVEGMLRMVERQVAKWNPDPKMREFLRPETLFGKEKFDGYYAAREEPILSQNRGGELLERQEGLRANLL